MECWVQREPALSFLAAAGVACAAVVVHSAWLLAALAAYAWARR
jgi:hypothetical protein